MQDYIIAKMQEAHIPEIAALEKECFGELAWSESLLAQELTFDYKHYKVVLYQDKVIGYGGFSQILNEAHIMNIAIASPYRRKGIGSLLMDALKQKAYTLGITRMTLEVAGSNRPAIEFYLQHNFQLFGIRPDYYSNKEDALILWCLLED